jgi:hypothetical protein
MAEKENKPSTDWTSAHRFLYHYTTEGGFRGIVESNSLRATYFADLNDSNEINELRVPLVQEMTTWFIPLIQKFRDKGLRERQTVSKVGGIVNAATNLARRWVNSLYSTTFESDATKRPSLCCITSFCSHAHDQPYERENGLLSQWRGYGGIGGFCLVFDTAKLAALLEKEKKSFFILYAALRPAFYFVGGSSVAELFSELLSFSKEIVGAAMEQKDFDPSKVFTPFVMSATTTKHRGFYEEREVRMVVLRPAEGTGKAEQQDGAVAHALDGPVGCLGHDADAVGGCRLLAERGGADYPADAAERCLHGFRGVRRFVARALVSVSDRRQTAVDGRGFGTTVGLRGQECGDRRGRSREGGCTFGFTPGAKQIKVRPVGASRCCRLLGLRVGRSVSQLQSDVGGNCGFRPYNEAPGRAVIGGHFESNPIASRKGPQKIGLWCCRSELTIPTIARTLDA